MQRRILFTKTLPVPGKAKGLIIGRGGKTIQEFQQTKGICSVRLSDGEVKICGASEEAVKSVASSIGNLIRIAASKTGYDPEFFVVCFCKSLQQPSLSVNEICFVKFTGEMSDSDDFGRNPNFCLKYGESRSDGSESRSSSGKSSKSDAGRLTVELERMALENKFFSHWDISGYGDVLLTCFQRLLWQLERSARTIKLIVRFGKDLFIDKGNENLEDEGFKSLSYLQKQWTRRNLRGRFSTACSQEGLRNLKVRLEMLQFVKVASVKKVSIHVTDLEDRLLPRYNVSVRCQNDEDILQNNEIRRVFAAGDYFQVLGVGRNAGEAEIKEAYRRCLIKLQYRMFNSISSDKAISKVDVAYQCLMDPVKREHYIKACCPVEATIPELPPLINNNAVEEKPVIKRVRKQCQRHAFVSFCREGQSTTDFRLGVSSHEPNMDVLVPEMVESIEEAWRNRTSDDLFVFNSSSRFRLLNIRYKETETYVTEDWKLRIAKVGSGHGHTKDGIDYRWECALSSRWFKWNDGIRMDMDSTRKTVEALVKEAANLSEGLADGALHQE